MDPDPRPRAGPASPPPDDTKTKLSSTPESESESEPPSPASAGPGSPAAAAAAAADEAARKPRACEACRGLKVRCEPAAADDDGPCRRCRKAGRSCVTTAPSRKRQKKTDSRVLELERRIDALTASLQARAAPPPLPPPPLASPGVAAGPSPRRDAPPPPRPPSQPLGLQPPPPTRPPASSAGVKRKAADDGAGSSSSCRRSPEPAPPLVPAPGERDVVDRGLVSAPQAAELFSRYNESMVGHMPAVVFPPAMSAAELRRSKPCLFLAVMAAAASETHRLQRALHRELMQLFAHRIVVAGDKSLELVQALHVAVVWYWPPEHFEELKFYQLVHMAAVMALDIGLGKPRPPARRGIPPFSWREAPRPPERRHDAQPDPTSLESRRAWLACHYFAANTAMSLHRPNLIRWSSFMTESLDLLASAPDAAQTDRYLCHLVWTHRKGEEIGIQFSMDDPGAAPVSITDARTQYALRALERDLEKYRASVPEELLQPTLETSFHLLSLYMHELVLHSNTSTEQLRPPFNTDAIRDGMVRRAEPLLAAHVDALAACLGAIAGILDVFLAMDEPAIRCLPVFSFVRVAYAVVVLMKMFFSASDPRSDLGCVIGRADLRVDFYLDALLRKFRLTAADDRCRPAAKFLVVLVMLKSWFMKQTKADPDPAAPAPAPASSFPARCPPRLSLNTPLQVLSEVATGREPGRPPRPGLASLPDMRPGPVPPDHDHHHKPLYRDLVSSASAGAGTSSPSDPAASFTPTAAANMGPASSSPSSMGAAAGGPAGPFPAPWMAPQQQQPLPAPPDWDPLAALPPGMDLDLESLGLPLDSYDAFAGGARMMLNEPWFADVFQGLPDQNVFPF